MTSTSRNTPQNRTSDSTMSPAERELRDQMPLEIGDGLQLRFAQLHDIDPVVTLVQSVFDQEAVGIWTRDLMEGSHPNSSYGDLTLVEEKATGRIVSAMNLVSQTWSYGGTHFRCGQPENVVTSPDYRRLGLVRRQFEIIHQLSAAREELMQVIWGRPWYYRQFGYEYAMSAEWGHGWLIHPHQIPMLPDGEAELVSLRPIQEQDYALVRKLYETGAKRSIFAAVKGDREWDFNFRGYLEGSLKQFSWHIICDVGGQGIGYLAQHDGVWWQFIDKLELEPGHAYLSVMPSVLRQLLKIVPEHMQVTDPERGRPTIELLLPADHPAGRALPTAPEVRRGMHVLYIRVPHVVSYLRHISTALEANLVGTEAEGYTGDLKISCFRRGVQIRFESGQIAAIDPWQPEDLGHSPAFPDLTLLQLICGLKRCAELMAAFPDCNVDDTNVRLLDALFPAFRGGLWLGN